MINIKRLCEKLKPDAHLRKHQILDFKSLASTKFRHSGLILKVFFINWLGILYTILEENTGS